MTGSGAWQKKSPVPRNWRCPPSWRSKMLLPETVLRLLCSDFCSTQIRAFLSTSLPCCLFLHFAVQLHQCEVSVYTLPYLWSHVLLCLGGWVHRRPRCVHRCLSVNINGWWTASKNVFTDNTDHFMHVVQDRPFPLFSQETRCLLVDVGGFWKGPRNRCTIISLRCWAPYLLTR